MKKVIIFGGTGFIGQSLAAYLSKKEYQPILIARNEPSTPLPYPFAQWDAAHIGAWKELLNGAWAIVNLAGRSVDCIKTPDNCDVILRSRVDSTRAIGQALQEIEKPPSVWIQMSTAHIYGDPLSKLCTEDDAPGYGLAPFVGQAWEQTFLDNLPSRMRGVRLRTSFVLGHKGGALQSLKKIVRLGLGGKVGNGKQGISWIHEQDLNRLILESITNESYKGIYIASVPYPVSNQEFMKTLQKKMKIPIGISAPDIITRLGAKYIFKTDPELALYGRYVKSARLEMEGFKFQFPKLKLAFEDLL